MNIGFRTRKKCILSVVAILALVSACGLFAQERWAVNLNALIDETQLQSSHADRIGILWWIPLEYWDAALGLEPKGTEEQLALIRETLSPYLLIVAVDGSIGPDGGATFLNESLLRASVAVQGQDGRSYPPLDRDAISADALAVASAIGPVIANLIGPLGRNMHFFFFPAEEASGRAIARATEPGELVIRLGEEFYRWRLPLGSLLKPKVCPIDGERMNGTWHYCPWHGRELHTQAD